MENPSKIGETAAEQVFNELKTNKPFKTLNEQDPNFRISRKCFTGEFITMEEGFLRLRECQETAEKYTNFLSSHVVGKVFK